MLCPRTTVITFCAENIAKGLFLFFGGTARFVAHEGQRHAYQRGATIEGPLLDGGHAGGDADVCHGGTIIERRGCNRCHGFAIVGRGDIYLGIRARVPRDSVFCTIQNVMQSVAGLFCTTRRTHAVHVLVAAEGGNLHISGMVAPQTSVVRVPPDFGTVGRFGVVVDEGVSQRRARHVGAIAAAIAYLVTEATFFGAGGRLRGKRGVGVAQLRRTLLIGIVVADGANINRVAFGGAGRLDLDTTVIVRMYVIRRIAHIVGP